MKKAIFIAATAQHVGKTTTCLGIMSGLQKRFDSMGFIKPVGQRHVDVNGCHADEDVVLFRERFGLQANYRDMSPVIVSSGYTRSYLDRQIATQTLRADIERGFKAVATASDYTVVEGTGHTGVGSIIDLSNADVAKLLDLEVILVSTGGIGAAFDQLALNKVLLESRGVKVRGIILNKVIPEKREMVLEYIPKALKKWDLPLVGCIPYSPLLQAPTMRDFEDLFSVKLMAGGQHRYRHIFGERFVATEKHHPPLNQIQPHEMLIMHASRDDLIQMTIDDERQARDKHPHGDLERAVFLTGHSPPSPAISEELKRADIPTLYVPLSSYKAMEMISGFTAKIHGEDVSKVDQAIRLVEENIDFSIFE